MIRDLKAVVKRNGTNSIITIHRAILDVHKIEYDTVFDIETYTKDGKKIIKLIERVNK